jgi:hypothetical protein
MTQLQCNIFRFGAMELSTLPIDRRKEERSQQPIRSAFRTFDVNLEEMGNTSRSSTMRVI